MSMGICPVLDSQPEFLRSTYNGGKDFVEHHEVLSEIAEMLGVRPLMALHSQSRADAVSEFGGEEGVQDLEARGYFFPAEQEWFSAAEGLKTVTALRDYLEANPGALGEDAEEDETAESVVMALQDIEELLRDAEKKRRRFHLTHC